MLQDPMLENWRQRNSNSVPKNRVVVFKRVSPIQEKIINNSKWGFKETALQNQILASLRNTDEKLKVNSGDSLQVKGNLMNHGQGHNNPAYIHDILKYLNDTKTLETTDGVSYPIIH